MLVGKVNKGTSFGTVVHVHVYSHLTISSVAEVLYIKCVSLI